MRGHTLVQVRLNAKGGDGVGTGLTFLALLGSKRGRNVNAGHANPMLWGGYGVGILGWGMG